MKKQNYLTNDPVIDGQNFALVSYIYDEKKPNEQAIKIRGVFETKEKANEYGQKLIKLDPGYDIHVAEIGKWVYTSHEQNSKILDVQYTDDKLNAIIKNYRETLEKHEEAKKLEIEESKKNASKGILPAKSYEERLKDQLKKMKLKVKNNKVQPYIDNNEDNQETKEALKKLQDMCNEL